MQWTIGKARVTKVIELEMAGGSRFLLPQATPDEVRQIDWLVPHFATPEGKLILSIHALIIETPGGKEGHAADVERLKKLRDGPPAGNTPGGY